jgi:aryl-alcohol dehydrogenase-like predicted oxidoreductase
MRLVQLAHAAPLAWVLRVENVAATIVGASRPEQVRENAAAADIDLDEETSPRSKRSLERASEWC